MKFHCTLEVIDYFLGGLVIVIAFGLYCVDTSAMIFPLVSIQVLISVDAFPVLLHVRQQVILAERF